MNLTLNRSVTLAAAVRMSALFSTITTFISFSHSLGAEDRGLAYSALSIGASVGLFDMGVSIGGVRRLAEVNSRGSITLDSLMSLARVCLSAQGTLKFLLIWQGLASICYLVFFAAAGLYFNVVEASGSASLWYIGYAIGSLATFSSAPVLTSLEGFGRIDVVNRIRITAELVYLFGMLVGFLFDKGLWALATAQLLRGGTLHLVVLMSKYRLIPFTMFRSLGNRQVTIDSLFVGERRRFQLFLAVAWIFGYFTSQITIPALNRVSGSVVAGRYGAMSLLAAGLTSFALIHVLLRFSFTARQAALGNQIEFVSSYRRSLIFAVIVYLTGSVAVFTVLHLDLLPSDRFRGLAIDLDMVAVLAVGLCQTIMAVLATLFRSLKTERFVHHTIILALANALGLALLVKNADITRYLSLSLTINVIVVAIQLVVAYRFVVSLHDVTPES